MLSSRKKRARSRARTDFIPRDKLHELKESAEQNQGTDLVLRALKF